MLVDGVIRTDKAPETPDLLQETTSEKKMTARKGRGGQKGDFMAEEKRLRAAAYARTSTDQEIQEGSFDLQVQHFRDMIKADPRLELVDVYGDLGKSGRDAQKRPEFQRMLSDCEAGKIDVIYTKSVSRFARNIADLVEVLQRLRELGVRVVLKKSASIRQNARRSTCYTSLGLWRKRKAGHSEKTCASALR